MNGENNRLLEHNKPITIHCNFELGIIGAIKQVLKETEIYRNVDINRNKIYGCIDNQN